MGLTYSEFRQRPVAEPNEDARFITVNVYRMGLCINAGRQARPGVAWMPISQTILRTAFWA